MSAPLFIICSADAVLQNLIGTNPFRLYPFGSAPQSPVKPYAVYQVIGGSPENYLAGRPDEDQYALQVDVYGDTAASCEAVKKAMIAAIELHSYITGFNGESKDPNTGNYRTSFDVDWIVSR